MKLQLNLKNMAVNPIRYRYYEKIKILILLNEAKIQDIEIKFSHAVIAAHGYKKIKSASSWKIESR